MTYICGQRPIGELAHEYVMLRGSASMLWDTTEQFDILQEMQGRCGPEHTETHLIRAYEVYRMIGLDQDPLHDLST
jgi:hypothetical protein